MKTNPTVFLGGTCNNSQWRDSLIPMLQQSNINFYNPVVPDWTPECMAEEIRQREICDYCLYVITPKMTGVFSIAEVVDDSNKRPEKTIFCYLLTDEDTKFNPHQIKSLNSIGKMIEENGGQFVKSFEEIVSFCSK